MRADPSPQRRILVLAVTLALVMWPIVGSIGVAGPVAVAAGNNDGGSDDGDGPTAAFADFPLGGAVDESIFVVAEFDDQIETYRIDWGDGTTEEIPTEGSHTYNSTGTYDVTLTVTDSQGRTDSVTRTLTVDSASDRRVIAVGESKPGTIDSDDPTTKEGINYEPVQFRGSKGEIVAIATDTDAPVQLSVRRTNGSTDEVIRNATASVRHPAHQRVELPADGEYTVRVAAGTGRDIPITYELAVSRLAAEPGNTSASETADLRPLETGTTVESVFGQDDPIDNIGFIVESASVEAAAGDRLNISFQTADDTVLVTKLTGPGLEAFPDSDDEVVVPGNGTYSVIVSGPASDVDSSNLPVPYTFNLTRTQRVSADRLVVDADGEVGDYTSIEQATDVAGPGTTIEIRPGTYTEQVNLDVNASLVAPDGATIVGDGSGTGLTIAVAADGAGPVIDGLTISNFGTGIDASGGFGQQVSDWRLRNVTVSDNGGFGVEVDSGAWTIQNTTIANNGGGGIDAFAVDGDWQVRNGIIRDNSRTGIRAGGTGGDWVVANTSIKNNDAGISALDTTGNWTVRGVTIDAHSAPGILAQRAGGNWTVISSTITRSGGNAGIDALDTTGNWTVKQTRVTDNAGDGILAFNTTGSWNVTGTKLLNNSEDGVFARESTGAWTVRDAVVRGNLIGVDAQSADGAWKISGSTFNEQRHLGINADRTDGNWIVRSTRITDNGIDSPRFITGLSAEASTGDWIVEQVRISGNGNNRVGASSTVGDWAVRRSLIGGVTAVGTTGNWTVRRSNIVAGVELVNARNASPQGDARRNWWGQPDGPRDDQCEGNVNCGEALSEPVDVGVGLFAGGTGTADNPYRIATAEQLQRVNESLGANFTIVSDIDASGTANWNDGAGFDPIGTEDNPFTGTFDGRNHTISGLTIDRPGEDEVGLFGASNGDIAHLALTDATVTGRSNVGSLAGLNNGPIAHVSVEVNLTGQRSFIGGLVGKTEISRGSLTNISVRGTVSGSGTRDSDVGGLVGSFEEATIKDSTVFATVRARSVGNVGGLVGVNNGGRITTSAAVGNVTGNGFVGGLVGANRGSATRGARITDSYSKGGVSGPPDSEGRVTNGRAIGGLIGSHSAGSTSSAVRRTYAKGPVAGGDEVGGLVGSNNAATIEQSYSTGTVTADGRVGGLVGVTTLDGRVTNSYWDTERAGQMTSDGGTGLSTAQITGDGARGNMSGFDFEDVWLVPGVTQYPELQALPENDERDASTSEITDWNDLDAIRENRGSEYFLANDLNETTPGYEEVAGPNANGGRGFKPIGNDSTSFTGTFDGKGNTISGLTINRAGANTVGLFGANDGTISNVTLSETTVTGGGPVGALVGENTGRVTEISAQVDVNGSGQFVSSVGGVVGKNRGGIVADASARGTVTSDGGISGIGGLVGSNDDGATIRNTTTGTIVTAPGLGNVGGIAGANANGSTIQQSAALGSVTGQNDVGGLVGLNSGAGAESTIVNAYSTGAVKGDRSIGGLVGANRDGAEVSQTYSQGTVTGTEEVGGLVGENAGSTVRKSYSTGTVEADRSVGGLIGLDASGEVVSSYWDTDASGQDSSAGGTGLTTAAMTGDPARENMSAFDFRRTWIVLDSDSYPELRSLLPGETSAFRITDVQVDRYLRDADGTVVTVEVTNQGDRPDTQDVTYRIPTEDAPRAGEVVETLRIREDVTLEPNESATFRFRLPDIGFEPPSDVGFRVDAVSNGNAISITNTGSGAIPATEVIVNGTNVSGVDGPTPLASLPAVDNNRTLEPKQSVTIPTANSNVTLRILGTTRITTTVSTFDRNRSVPVFLLPITLRPVPTLTTSYEQPIPVATDTRFEVGQSVMSYFNRGGSRASERVPTVAWDFGSLADAGAVDTEGPVAMAKFENPIAAPAAVSVEFAEPTTTFRMETIGVGTPDEIPPVLKQVANSDAYYISDPSDELNSTGGTTLRAEFQAQFLASDQISQVTFAPSWLEDGNVTVTDGSDGWNAAFDVTAIPNTNKRTGPDATLTIVATDDQGRTVEEQDLYVTDPPEWAENIYVGGGKRLTADNGRVREAIVIPKGGFDFTVDAPSGTPIIGGKEVGVSGSAAYGIETNQFERYASRYGEGRLELGVPVSAVVNVNQTATAGAVAEYRIPEWRLNGKARFYANGRTLLTRPIPVRLPGRIPVVGGQGFNVSGYAGPGYGIELRLSGIQGDTLTLDEALGYANFTAGAEGGTSVAGQEAFAFIDGEVEGNSEVTIDNTPERFSEISGSDIDFGGRITGEAGARIRAPRIGGEYSDSITFVSVGSKNVERPGPPFASISSANVVPPALPDATTSFKLDGSSTGPLDRSVYDPVDGALTDNNLNDTDPAIGGAQGNYTVAWSGDGPDRPQPERAEIYVRDYVDRSFGERTRLTDDTAYNVDPTVARAPDGTTLVAWARIENDRLRNISSANLTFQDVRNQSEIAYAVNDGTGWSETRVLTNDTRYQGAPVAAGFDNGFVIAYERDGDFDYTTLTDETVRYARLSGTGAPVENGTLGNGLHPRATTGTDGTAVQVARERRTATTPADIVVASVDDTGMRTTRTESVVNLTTFDVATGAVAWANTTTEGASRVTVASGSSMRTVPLGNGTTVQELRLATAGDRQLLQYQGTNPTVDTGFLPNPRTTYYQRFRNGSWSPARTVNQAVNSSQILYDHAVTSDVESFVSVAAGVEFGASDVDDLYYVDHEYRPDLAVSVPANDRDTVANASVGETVDLNVTVANTGDTGTGQAVPLTVGNGTGETRSTVTLDPIAPGADRTVSVSTTVTQTGQVRIVADESGALQELSEANNNVTLVAERPRLTVVDAEQTRVEDGVQINATVRNGGSTVVTNATAQLVNNNEKASTALTESLAPGDTREISLNPSLATLNASQPGYVSVRATAPSEQPIDSRETLPLQQAGPTIAERSLQAFHADNTTVVAVTIENNGLTGGQRTLQIGYGGDQRTRQVCVPPATQDRPTTYRRALVTAPGLSDGATVTASLRAPTGENGTQAIPATSGGTAARVDVQPTMSTTPPVVAGRVPADADCDGAYEDFNRDGAVTTTDARVLFDVRSSDSVAAQRPRFDGNNDTQVNVHDIQTVFAEATANGSSAQSGDGSAAQGEPTAVQVQPATTELSVPVNGTTTLAVIVPDKPVGAFNITARTQGTAAHVTDISATNSNISEMLADRDGGPALVAAGHDDNNTILRLSVAGRSPGEADLIIDTDEISDDTGNVYESPDEVVVSLDVAEGVDDGESGTGSSDSGGSDSGGNTDGSESGSEQVTQEPQINITDLPDGITATVSNVDASESIRIGPTTVRTNAFTVTEVTATFGRASAAESNVRVDAEKDVPAEAPSLKTGSTLGYVQVNVNGMLAGQATDGSFTFRADNKTAIQRSSMVQAYHYNESMSGWEPIETKHLGGDEFRVTTSGFSVFGIVVEQTGATPTPTEITTQTQTQVETVTTTPTATPSDEAGGFPIGPLVGLVALIVILGAIYLLRR